jgi:hypothetical protein
MPSLSGRLGRQGPKAPTDGLGARPLGGRRPGLHGASGSVSARKGESRAGQRTSAGPVLAHTLQGTRIYIGVRLVARGDEEHLSLRIRDEIYDVLTPNPTESERW